MDIGALWEALHGALYVYVDEDLELVFTWHGSCTVGIRDSTLDEIDCFTMPRSAAEGATFQEVGEHIQTWIANLHAEESAKWFRDGDEEYPGDGAED